MAEVTAQTLTDEQIREFRESLPRGYYAFQWTVDAVADPPGNRRDNARREIAAAINARANGG